MPDRQTSNAFKRIGMFDTAYKTVEKELLLLCCAFEEAAYN